MEGAVNRSKVAGMLGRLRWLFAGLILLSAVVVALYLIGGASEEVRSMDGFSCEGGKQGWKRADAITPDLVLPCQSGSTGICAVGFEYVSGTGWCRPRG